MVLSLFTVIPVNAAEIDDDSAAGAATSYQIVVGTTLVTSDNCRNILGNNTASYDPNTNTLTLNNPNLTEAKYANEALIYIVRSDNVTVRGSFTMSGAKAKCGIESTGPLTFDGNFTFIGKKGGAAANMSMNINGGSLTAIGSTDSDSVGLSVGEGYGIEIADGITQVRAKGNDASIFADTLTLNNNRITSPQGAFFKEYYGNVVLEDFSDVARDVTIKPGNITDYDVWVGYRRVTSANKSDIYGDGKVSYDPATKILTLNNPNIPGGNTPASNTRFFKIYSKDDLTVKGSYTMPQTETFAGEDALYGGVYSAGALTFDGSFTFYGKQASVIAEKDINIASGTLTVVGSETTGVLSNNGKIIIPNNVKVDADSQTIPIIAKGFEIGDKEKITYPDNWAGLAQEETLNSQYFIDTDNKTIKHIVIEYSEPTEVTNYPLWLGEKRVTSENCNDIFGDGKASYNDNTKVLTLNDPTIPGANTLEGYTVKITSGDNLNIVGSYHIPANEDVSYGLFSNNSVKLDGDFTFNASNNAVYCSSDLTIASGSLTAKGNSTAAVSVGNTFKIENGVTKVELEGKTVPVLAKEITLGDKEKITEPEGGVIAYIKSLEKYTIALSSGAVKKAVVEYDAPVVPTTEPPTTQPPTTQPTTTPVDPGTLDLNGSGTSDAPYLIQSTADWNKLAAYISNGGNTNDKHFMLTENITVTAMLGTGSNAFKGVFDGDGHTLTLDISSDERNCAPFSCIEGATIRNLKTGGTLSGSIHCSGLVGGINGSEDNLIDNCTVAAEITCSAANCGGFVGHGGKLAKTTVKNCVFSGSINNAETAGTIWGWSDDGSTPVLENCLDVSSSDHPIGRGFPRPSTLPNCYYTNPNKDNTGWRSWTNFGKLAYTVTLSDGSLSLSGTTGIKYDGKLYAAEGEDISLTASDSGILYKASAGTLSQKGGSLTLTMPAGNVTQNYRDITASHKGFNNEGCECLLDGKTDTKWCVGTTEFPITLDFSTRNVVKPEGVILTTANDTKDNPARNPVSWKLEASNDGENWTTLIEVTNDDTLGAENFKPYAFSFSSADKEYSWFRFSVNAIPSGDLFQLSELQLVGKDTGVPANVGQEYNLWLGSTRVNDANKNDILGDGGKAKFDPETCTLTLDNPKIDGLHIDDWKFEAKIYCKYMDLKLKGRYFMQGMEGNCCIEVEYGSVTIAGDFVLKSYGYAIYVDNDVIFDSGIIDLYGLNNGTVHSGNKIIINNSVNMLIFGTQYHYSAKTKNGIELGNNLVVTTPAGYTISGNNISEKKIVIEPCTEYDLWLGSTRVTALNRNDIFGDGKASYDALTHTLTLDEPEITDSYTISLYFSDYTVKIYSKDDLTIKGSYHTTVNAMHGFGSQKSLTLDGDFSVTAKEFAYSASENITIRSGVVVGKSKYSCFMAPGTLTVENGVKKVEAHFEEDYLAAGSYSFGDKTVISEPQGGYIDVSPEGYQAIYNSDGTYAHDVVIFGVPSVVSFDMNGHGKAVKAQDVYYGKKAAEPAAPSEEHYIFGGWFTDKECTKAYDFNTSVTDDITLYAKWTVRKYTVTFVNEDNTVLQQSEVDYGTMPEYKGTTPIKKPDAQNSYEFTGWSPEIAKVTGEATYKATFKSVARKLPIGDVNGDGNVTIDDATMIQKFVAELVELTPDQLIAADTNCDGVVTIDDATNIQKFLAEIINHFG